MPDALGQLRVFVGVLGKGGAFALAVAVGKLLGEKSQGIGFKISRVHGRPQSRALLTGWRPTPPSKAAGPGLRPVNFSSYQSPLGIAAPSTYRRLSPPV